MRVLVEEELYKSAVIARLIKLIDPELNETAVAKICKNFSLIEALGFDNVDSLAELINRSKYNPTLEPVH